MPNSEFFAALEISSRTSFQPGGKKPFHPGARNQLQVMFPTVNWLKTDAANPGGPLDMNKPYLNGFSRVLIPIGLDGGLIQLWPWRFILG
jgi:hypothetical protein